MPSNIPQQHVGITLTGLPIGPCKRSQLDKRRLFCLSWHPCMAVTCSAVFQHLSRGWSM